MNRLGVAAAAVCALVACGSTGGAQGITQTQAVTLARGTAQPMSVTPVVVVSATSGQLSTLMPNPPPTLGHPSREVWAVFFSGTFQGSCGGAPVPPQSPHPCPPPNTSVRVLLDYVSGAFIVATTPADGAMLHIRRQPGLFILPPLDRSITDAAVVMRLASDFEQLPPLPSGTFSCPADAGPTYTLAFSIAGTSPWSAVISVAGCRAVTLSDGPTRWAALNTTPLFTDLRTALGLTQDELVPAPCPAVQGGHCYPQPTL